MLEQHLIALPCAICNKRVRLDECKVNGFGEPVHEACLAKRLKEEVEKRKVSLERSQLRHTP